MGFPDVDVVSATVNEVQLTEHLIDKSMPPECRPGRLIFDKTADSHAVFHDILNLLREFLPLSGINFAPAVNPVRKIRRAFVTSEPP